MALLICAAASTTAGCGAGGSDASPAGLRLQREDLVAVVRALQGRQAEAAAAARASKAAWPAVVHGLPASPSKQALAAIAQARARAEALRLPGLFGELKARSLAGASASLAGDYRSFATLTAAGWREIEYSIERTRTGPPPAAAFARANVPLYIETIYDAHFTLFQISRRLPVAYKKLGGPATFGSSLTQLQVDALSSSYSEANYRLQPKVTVRLGS
ncbi:MAG TPA: hypothetical protein VGD00_11055 [Solirubrobacteraceae bacterium]